MFNYSCYIWFACPAVAEAIGGQSWCDNKAHQHIPYGFGLPSRAFVNVASLFLQKRGRRMCVKRRKVIT